MCLFFSTRIGKSEKISRIDDEELDGIQTLGWDGLVSSWQCVNPEFYLKSKNKKNQHCHSCIAGPSFWAYQFPSHYRPLYIHVWVQSYCRHFCIIYQIHFSMAFSKPCYTVPKILFTSLFTSLIWAYAGCVSLTPCPAGSLPNKPLSDVFAKLLHVSVYLFYVFAFLIFILNFSNDRKSLRRVQ